MIEGFVHLDWDTEFFGFNVACIMQTVSDGDALSQTIQALRNNNYKLAYLRVFADNSELFDIVKSQGGRLVDEKVTYIKKIDGIPNLQKISQYVPFSYTKINPNADMIELALQSGQYSRFRLDPKFPQHLYIKLYTSWITRSVNKEIAWDVLVVQEAKTLGMITLGTKDNRADIGLLVVAEHARGQGIGSALIAEAERCFRKKNYVLSQVVTQKANLDACNFYESCGYEVEKIEKTFHFWL